MLGTIFRTVFFTFTIIIWLGVITTALIDDSVVDNLIKPRSKPDIPLDRLGLSYFSDHLERQLAISDDPDQVRTVRYKLRFDYRPPLRLSDPISSGLVTSPFAKKRYHPVYGKMLPHHGIDYGAPLGTPVMAVADGQISFVGRALLAGNMLKIAHSPGKESRYLHLSGFSPRAKLGQHVQAGETIGYVGQSGLATGPHLHFEVWLDGKPVSPDAHQLAKLAQHASPLWRNYQKSVRRALTFAGPLPKLTHSTPDGGWSFASVNFGK